jgi:hypothetical protein
VRDTPQPGSRPPAPPRDSMRQPLHRNCPGTTSAPASFRLAAGGGDAGRLATRAPDLFRHPCLTPRPRQTTLHARRGSSPTETPPSRRAAQTVYTRDCGLPTSDGSHRAPRPPGPNVELSENSAARAWPPPGLTIAAVGYDQLRMSITARQFHFPAGMARRRGTILSACRSVLRAGRAGSAMLDRRCWIVDPACFQQYGRAGGGRHSSISAPTGFSGNVSNTDIFFAIFRERLSCGHVSRR